MCCVNGPRTSFHSSDKLTEVLTKASRVMKFKNRAVEVPMHTDYIVIHSEISLCVYKSFGTRSPQMAHCRKSHFIPIMQIVEL